MTKNLKQLAIAEFNTFGEWPRDKPTIFENSKHLVWIQNEGGFATMTAMQKSKKSSGRRYSEVLTIGSFDPMAGWKVSEHLDKSYPVWVTTTKRIWGVV